MADGDVGEPRAGEEDSRWGESPHGFVETACGDGEGDFHATADVAVSAGVPDL